MLELHSPSFVYETTSPIGLFGHAYFTIKELMGCDEFLLFSCNANDLDFDFTDFFKSSYCKKIKPVPIKMFNSEININLIAGRNQLSFGLFEYEIVNIGNHVDKNDPPKFWTFFDGEGHSWYGHFIAVRKKDRNNFYRFFKKNEKSKHKVVEAPILPHNILNDVYENSIAFLKRGTNLFEQYKEYKIPIKRGILLSGNPGSGKTLTCKWIKHLATKNNLLTKIVTIDAYAYAMQQKNLKSLFEFGNRRRTTKKQSGIIFFDDMDMLFKDRETGNTDVYNFLTHLDGIEPNEGVVYIFTTNLIKELDPAFVRPGRIDLFHVFKNPGAALRGLFIDKQFHKDIKSQINVGRLIEDTDEHSFAELEEIRKLLCIDIMSGKEINLEKTMELFKKHRSDFSARLGFKSMSSYDDSDDERVYPFEPNWM